MRMLRRVALLSTAAAAGLLVVLVIRTLSLAPLPEEQQQCNTNETDYIFLSKEMTERFQRSLQFATVSRDVGNYDRHQLEALVNFVTKSFPAIHLSPLVTWQIVANYSLLYVVRGSNQQLKPYLLMSHLDVVPADDVHLWEFPPFSGEVHDGFIYGRGSIDDKHSVIGILEALNFKLKLGWKPSRTLYIAFGHDEECRGADGAGNIASLLSQQNAQFEFILDEGLMIIKDALPGLMKPVALIGISEKGYLSVKLSVTKQGGHSSIPAPETSIGILASAVARLEANPHRSFFGRGPEIFLLELVAPYLAFAKRLVMANLWLFGPLVSQQFSANPAANSWIRTTTAITMFHAGVKENVLPQYAEAIINHRVHPLQPIDEVLQRDRDIINDDRVQMEVIGSSDPHPMSECDKDSFGFQMISRSVRQVFASDDVLVSPAVLSANTDTKHYLSLSPNIYRFSPAFLGSADLPRFHGINERISVNNYERVINFYSHLISNADKASLFSDKSHKSHSTDL